MGPLDPTPPMVSAQGYGAPVGAPTAPVDQTAMIADLLRRRNLAQRQATMAAGNAQQYGSMFQNPQFQQTIRGANGQPDLVQANWGDILGKGVANYMSGKERKESINKTQEVAQINSDFMQTTLKGDPVAQKLYGAVQAGVPGAEKALTDHMAPKKEAMAGLVQGITSGSLSPEMAAEVAARYNLDPNVVSRAAAFASQKKQEQANTTFAGKATLQDMKDKAALDRQNQKPTKTGYTQEELNAMPIEQRLAAVQAASGRETAESKGRAKLKLEAEQNLPKTQYALDNINRVIGLAEKADFWPGNLGLKNSKATTNPNNVNLRQAIYQLTLDANNGSLGTGFSNADRDFLLAAQANLDAGNMKTVTYQLRNLITRLQQKQEAFKLNAGVGAAPATTPAAAPAGGTSSAPSFEDAWKEVGGE